MMRGKRGSQVAIGVTAAVLGVGVGTVAAQSMGTPWWTQTGLVVPADVTVNDGSVSVYGTAFSGSIAKAKANFPTTGEYIGCKVTAVANNGQTIECAARDADGVTGSCFLNVTDANLGRREAVFINTISSIGPDSYVTIDYNGGTGQCLAVSLSQTSADFLAFEGGNGGGGGVSECEQSNSTNLGGFGGSGAAVNDAGCAMVAQFAQPFFSYGPDRTMQLQNPAGTTSYPLAYEYAQSCTGASGSGTFDAAWDDQFLPGLSDACPLYIKLGGSGAGTITLSYF